VEKYAEKITSRTNPVCVHLKKLGANKSYRYQHKEFLCEGEKLLNEAIISGIQITKILTSKSVNFTLPQGINIYNTTPGLIDSLSPLKNTQGLLFSCKIPEPPDCDHNTGIHILLDNIQDPGNVGTIIRTANAFDIETIILTEGCADIYNLKTIRASMGSLFKQKVLYMNDDKIFELKQSDIKFIAAVNNTEAVNIRDSNLQTGIIIMGNEGQGISQNLLSLCDEFIKIPISHNCESLNVAVAASIIMWEIKSFNMGN